VWQPLVVPDLVIPEVTFLLAAGAAMASYHWSVTELRVTVPDETAERLASVAADRGTSVEILAAEVLNEHAPSPMKRSLPFIGMFEAPKGAITVAEAERRLEDGEDESFGR
jgi:hypothetical protein